MKKLLILLIYSLVIVSILSSCMIDKKTETTKPIIVPTITQVKTIPVSSTATALLKNTQEATPIPITMTPSPSKTAISQIITVTAKPTYTDLLDGKLIILREFTVNYLEDILTGRVSKLFAEEKSIDILRWAGNGCTLIAATTDEIVEMDLKGKILRTIFPFERLHDLVDEYILIDPPYYRRAIDMLSPDESWIVYRIGSGTYEQMGSDFEPYRFEYENLETMSVDGTQGPYRLSQNGGAWRAAWSPNSEQIAYSDFDDKGIHQLFIINRDGTNRRQVTSFTHPRMQGTSLTYPAGEILKIIWSPNGEKIALLIDQGDHWSTIVLYIDEKSSEALENISAEWWRDNNSFVAWKIVEQEPWHAELITLDTNTNKEFTIRPEGCHRINPFGNPSMVGCMTLDYDFFAYDTQSGNAVMYPKFNPNRLEIHYWIAAPDSYPGVIGCGFTP